MQPALRQAVVTGANVSPFVSNSAFKVHLIVADKFDGSPWVPELAIRVQPDWLNSMGRGKIYMWSQVAKYSKRYVMNAALSGAA